MANYVKIGMETAFGTEAGTVTGVLVTGVNDTVDRGTLIEETTSDYLARSAYGGALQPSGSIDANLRALQGEDFIYALMGIQTTLGTTRTYTFGTSKSMSIKVGEDTSEQSEITYTGCGVTSMDFTFEAKDFIKTSINWMAKDLEDTSSAFDSAVTYINEQPIVFYRAYITLDGDTTIGIKSLSMTVDRGLDSDQFVLGSFKRYRLASTSQSSVTGSLTFTENEFDSMLKAMFGSSTATIVPANNVLGGGSMVIECQTVDGVSNITFTCPVSVYNNVNRSSSGKTEIEKTVDYTVINELGSPFSIAITDDTTVPVSITSITATNTYLSVACSAVVVGSPTSYLWNFGDGEVSDEVAPTHVYASADTYTITLTIDKMDSASDTDTTSVTVAAEP